MTERGQAGLGAALGDPGGTLLALDFDGVLAPIVPDPDQSRAHPEVVPVLVRLAPHLGTIAIVTGRPAAVAVDYGALAGVDGLSGLVVLGHYGAERWDAASGHFTSQPVPPGVAAVRRQLPGLLAERGLADVVHIEDKDRSVAVHTRRAPQPAEAFEALRGPLGELAAAHGLAVEPGRLVIELRPPGVDKGVALRRLADERAARTVIYAGDDLGDLAAFDAVDEMRDRGVAGLLVCSGSAEVTALAERADVVVDGPPGVVALLDALATTLEG
jgi:trehalose 6-phosphate phosphatase